jgi:serine/threonine protein kinase
MHSKRLADPVCYPYTSVECLDDNVASEFVSGGMAATAVTRVEGHLASCRDCRALVAALAGDEADSNAATHQHEKIEDSQVAKRPVLSIGDRVGRYLVLATLGSGGMGVVFTAYDPQLDRKVALKLLRGNLGANTKEARTRLKREAQAIAQLNHPNVVGVYDVGATDDGDVYIAMEFVEGDTLTTWLKRWPRTWREILDVYSQAGRGLMAAHSVGLLHRDFKPDNVLVGGDGRVRVTDFGLARSLILDDSARGAITSIAEATKARAAGSPLQVDLTATGTVLGTPRYMPPEQLTTTSIDARADQFSFCVALYEALYGTHPLKGSTSVAMLEEGAKALPPPDSKGVPSLISKAVMRGLEKERQKRFPTMATLMQELTPPPQRSPMKFIAFAAVGALLVTGATAAVLTQQPDPARKIEQMDEPTIKVLVDLLNKKDAEIKDLRQKVAAQIKDVKELETYKLQLDRATEDVIKLQDEIIKLRASQVPNAKPMVTEITSVQISNLIQVERSSVEFCLDDLDSRVTATEGAPRSRDIDVVVKLTSRPDGSVVDETVKTSGLDYSPATRLCLEGALKRVPYPKGSEFLDLRVTVAWSAGQLNMVANVVGQHAPRGSNLDGI